MITIKRFIAGFIAAGALAPVVFATVANGQSYAILPQRVAIEARTGASFSLPIKALSFSDSPILIEMEHLPNAWTYDDSRGPSPVNARADSVLQARDGNQLPWFDYPSQVEIRPNAEDQVIPVTVNLPDNVSGTYEGEFIVQEVGLDQLLTIGYRTTYQIIITNRPSYPLIDVQETAFEWKPEQLSLDIGIKNTGNAALVLGGEFQIFSEAGGRRRAVLKDTLEQVTLSAGDIERIEQPLPASFPSGNYGILVSPKIDEQRLRPMSSSTTLLNAYEFGGTIGNHGIASVPNLVRASIAPAGRRNFPLLVRNASEQSKAVSLKSIEWLSEAPEALTMTLTPEAMTLQAGQERSLRLLVISGPDYEPSPTPHYASIYLNVFDEGEDVASGELMVLLEISDGDFNPVRDLSFSNPRIVADATNQERSVLQYDVENNGALAETPFFFLSLGGPGEIGSVIENELVALKHFIGPGQSKTEEVSLAVPLTLFQAELQNDRSSQLDVIFEAVQSGERQRPVRANVRVEGLGAE